MLLSTIGLSEDMTKSLEAIGVTDVKVEKGEFWGSVPSSVSFRNNASDFDKVNRTWVVNGKPVIKQTGKTAAYDSYMYISIISETPPIRSADESKVPVVVVIVVTVVCVERETEPGMEKASSLLQHRN